MRTRSRCIACFLVLMGWLLTGCGQSAATKLDYRMGEMIPFGSVTYNVIDSAWSSQLGDGLNVRVPQQRFLVLTVSVANSGGSDISVPLFSVENASGQEFRELDNGQGLDNWFGLLRTLSPAQTQQGRIIFDVPLGSYRLRLTDGAGPGAEKYTWVQIPLRMDVDSDITPPGLGPLGR